VALDSWPFAVLTAVGLILFYVSRNSLWRKGVLIGLSGAFISSFIPHWKMGLGLIGYGLAVIVAGYWQARRPGSVLLAASLAVLTLGFLWLKGYLALLTPSLPISGMVAVGISYILFRAIQILCDLNDGTLELHDLTLPDLVLHLFLFLTFPAGPIARYEDSKAQFDALGGIRLEAIDLNGSIFRISLGYAKIVALAPWLLSLHADLATSAPGNVVSLASAALVFLAYVYANFSGYMDIIVGIGALFGLSIPENFDKPYLATSFLDLWNRWHITLSRTFQTYVFYPLVRLLSRARGRSLVPGLISYLVVFFLLGFWHGATPAFAIFGLMLGLGAAGCKLLEYAWNAASGNRFVEYARSSNIWAMTARAFAIAWFAISSIAIWPSVTTIGDLKAAVAASAPWHVAAALLLATLLVATVDTIFRLVAVVVQLLPKPRASGHSGLGTPGPAIIGLLVVIAFTAAILAPKEFNTLVLYQRY